MNADCDRRPVRGLSIMQPWVWCICYAGKDVENRTWWPPPWLYGKRIALHASKGFDSEAVEYLVYRMGLVLRLPERPSDYPRGAIVATAILERASDQVTSEWFGGPVGFLLADVRVLREPIKHSGALRFWNMPDDVADRVARSAA